MRKVFVCLIAAFCAAAAVAQTVDITDMLDAFEKSPTRASSAYGKGRVSVRGWIDRIEYDIAGDPVVVIEEADADSMPLVIGRQIAYTFTLDDLEELMPLVSGREIVLSGMLTDGGELGIYFADAAVEDYFSATTAMRLISDGSAEDVYACYERNAIRADSVFRGEEITVTGVVCDVDTDDITDQQYIQLSGIGETFDIFGIKCLFPNRKSKFTTIDIGDIVTITGTVGEYFFTVDLEDCRLD